MDKLEQAQGSIVQAEKEEGWEDYADAQRSYIKATAYASVAQVEAARPRFIRLGDITINVAHIAYVRWNKLDSDGKPMIEITFLAAGSQAVMGICFYDDEVEPVADALRGVLEPFTVAAVDFPEPDPAP